MPVNAIDFSDLTKKPKPQGFQTPPPQPPQTVMGVKKPDGTETLQKADLSNSKLSYARLDNVKFRKAILRGVDFSYASLRNCDFRDSDLTDVNFGNADLTGAKLEGTILHDG